MTCPSIPSASCPSAVSVAFVASNLAAPGKEIVQEQSGQSRWVQQCRSAKMSGCGRSTNNGKLPPQPRTARVISTVIAQIKMTESQATAGAWRLYSSQGNKDASRIKTLAPRIKTPEIIKTLEVPGPLKKDAAKKDANSRNYLLGKQVLRTCNSQ